MMTTYELTTVKASEVREGDLFTEFSPDLFGFAIVTSVSRVARVSQHDLGHDYVQVVQGDDRDLYEPDKEFQILRPVPS